jgi:DNA polymerase
MKRSSKPNDLLRQPIKTKTLFSQQVDAETLSDARQAALACKACDLWKRATQTVFGEGPENARIIFVGEQPGDREDLEGRPFVGPAGKLFDEALQEAGINRSEVYITNAVKHFKWSLSERGKRRIHQKPNDIEITSCRPWLEAELRIVQPKIVVCLGATAAQAFLGKSFRVTRRRGELVASPLFPHVLATVHPSSILRAPDEQSRKAQRNAFVTDLRKVARLLYADKKVA